MDFGLPKLNGDSLSSIGKSIVSGAISGALDNWTKDKYPPATTRGSKKDDPFSLDKFIANVGADGNRLAKGYYYVCHLYVTENDITKPLAFHCSAVTLPGWKAKTQTGKIYGISYEVAYGIEQDPIWMTFNVDIGHKTEEYMMNRVKRNTFNYESYSPTYKEDNQFNMDIEVTDEEFQPLFLYTCNNCIIKTVQQVNYSATDINFLSITVEVAYEDVTPVEPVITRRASAATKIAGGPMEASPFASIAAKFIKPLLSNSNGSYLSKLF